MLVLDDLVGLHRTIWFQLLQHHWSGHTWITVLLNGLPWKQTDHSVIFEIAPKYCISNSFVDCEGYSIYSKGFLPTVVDIMVFWVKFTHCSPFSLLILIMSIFTLAISRLTTSNLPWFMEHSRSLCNIAVYKVRLCFHHQSHPQLGFVFALAPSFHSFWNYFSTDLH